jgi:tetratricopeptide (TPR) repeat protein
MLILVVLLMGAARLSMTVENNAVPVSPPVKPNPLTENILYAAGLAFSALGNHEAARFNFARIRKIDPSSPLGYAPVGMVYIGEGRLDQALYWMREAQAVDPRDFYPGAWMVLLYDCLEDYDSAGEWTEWLNSRVTNQSGPMAILANHYYLAGNFELALQYSNIALKLDLSDRGNSDAIFMRIKRDEALAEGDPESGVLFFAARHPELFRLQPEITANNIGQATDLALLLKMAGRSKETERLLGSVLNAYDQPYLTSTPDGAGLIPVKAEALAILGEKSKSLTELKRIIDKGWRLHWRWKTELNPNFIDVRDSEEFRAMVAELEADMARQRSLAQEMAMRGEIAQPPESGAE